VKDTFYGYHPIVNFAYFAAVLAFAMVFTHPFCLGASLVCAIAYSVYLSGKKAVRFNLVYMLPLLIVTALINPAFSHQGATILTYLPSGNPLTLESILYGLSAAVMLIAVIAWFSCFNSVITSDKFVYLFGRIIPALSLILSMSLRFVPRFRAQIKVISNAQKCVGRDVSNGSLWRRAKHGIKILSIMITWALENAIETADSMKGRGYGLPGRTAFSIFRFDRRDATALTFTLVCAAYVIAGAVTGGLTWRYFPTTKGSWGGVYTVSIFAAYLALCAMPLILNVKEDFKWRALREPTKSKI
jgi:energy-coupling factor transport system permease protein